MTHFLAALGFLTVIPVPAAAREPAALERSVPWFPAVGLLLGALAAACAWAARHLLPPLPAAVAAVTVMALFSKGLHLDGLADSADGMMSGRPREGKLAIMRDSRIGTMGALALIAVLGLKVACLSGLAGWDFVKAAFLAPLGGRAAMAMNLSISPYARPDGLGTLFFRRRSPLNAAPALLALVFAAATLKAPGALAAAAAVIVLVPLWAAACRRVLGGATGDTVGACGELAEMLVPLAYCVSLRQGPWMS